jgi:uncharacterized protein (TIGR02466 family)
LSDIARSMRAIAAEDATGREWSERFGYRGYCGCATKNDIHLSPGPMQDLARWLSEEASLFSNDCAFDLKRPPRLERMWVNLLRSDGHHRSHVHAHSIISGAIFIEAPQGAGATCFEDPRLGLMMAAPPRANGAPEVLHTFVAMEPRAGLTIMWESWLRHEVLAGDSKEERLSITFDFI